MKLVYLSPVHWHSFAQRPHKFVQWWHSATGGEVLWVNPYPSRFPRWSDLARLRRGAGPAGEPIPAWLQVTQAPTWPVEPLPLTNPLRQALWQTVLQRIVRFTDASDTTLVIGKPSRLAVFLSKDGPYSRKWYDAMDDFPAFHQGQAGRVMAIAERQIVSHMDRVITSSTALATKFTPWHTRVVQILNGLDPATIPDQLFAPRNHRPPVLGYVGTIREWFDWNLVSQIAEAAPEWKVRLIGPLDHPPPSSLPSNVECLPACSHGAAIEQMARFSAGLIPFRLNRLTHAVDPIKYYEYAALGLPVLSTVFGEMANRSSAEGVYHLARDEDPLPRLHAALAWQNSEEAIRGFRQAHSWAARFDSAGLLQGSLPQQAAVTPERI